MTSFSKLNTHQLILTGSALVFLILMIVVAVWYKNSTATPPTSTQSQTQPILTAETYAEVLNSPLSATTTEEIPAVTETPKTVSTPTPSKKPQKQEPEQKASTTKNKVVVNSNIDTPEQPTVQITEMLRGHNAIRNKKGLSPLTWSTDLAKGAQAWSEVLQGEGCRMRHNYTSGYGENIYWSNQNGGNINKMISTDTAANQAWIEEEKYYDYDSNTCDSSEQCGHYTQIVWENTTKVGCGVSSCFADNSRTDIWVCRYDPQGNIIGQKPY